MTEAFTFGHGFKSKPSKYLPFGCPKGFASETERDAMTEGLSGLLEILSWSRPHGSEAELEFIKAHVLAPLKSLGVPYEVDNFGNVWANVKPHAGYRGAAFLWSCHVDTVAAKGGRQSVQFDPKDGRTIELVKRKPGRCLGADDGAGIWLLFEMIRAGVPGGYVFHRGEEKGRLGSCHVADNEPERLAPYAACVAFDRRDFADLITHQMGRRCASEAFASGLSGALNASGRGLSYRPDDGGSYTDSYSYADLVSECANVSVGYDREHGPNETLDGLHLWRLRQALVSADLGDVRIERDPSQYESAWDDNAWDHAPYSYGNVTHMWSGNAQGQTVAQKDTANLIDLIKRFPEATADLLETYGLGCDELIDAMTMSEQEQALASGGGWNHD